MKNFKDRRDTGDLPSILKPLKKTTDAVENITEKLPTENLSALKDVPNKLTEPIENVTEKLPLAGLIPLMGMLNYIKKFFLFIFTVIRNIFLWIKKLFQLFIAIPIKIYLFTLNVIKKIWSWIQAIFQAFINLIIKIYEFIIDIIRKVFFWVKIIFQVFIAIPVKTYLFIVNIISQISSFVRYIVKICIALITTIGKFLKLLFLNPLSLLTNPLQSLKSIGNTGGEIVDKLPEGLGEATDNLSGGLGEVTDNLSEGLGEVTDNLSEGLGEVTDNLSGGLEKVTGNLLGSRQNKKTKNQDKQPLGNSKKKIPESDLLLSQQDSSELPTDIVEQFQPPEEESPSGLPLFLESSEPPTDIEQEDPDVVSPAEISDTSDEVYKQNEGLIYIQDLYSNGKVSNLYTLDIKSGKTVLIGSMGMQIVDIAFCGNILYGIRWRNSNTTDLVRINPTTAKTTIIGKLGNSKVASLAFSKHRNYLYAMGPQTLLKVNVNTGSGRIIKSYKSCYPLYCGGLAFDSKGRGYSDFGNNYNQQRYLMRLNNNATPIAVGGVSGVKNSGCLDFYGDELFAIFNGKIFKYDLVTGKARFLTYTEKNVSWAGMSIMALRTSHKPSDLILNK
ncbi:phage tail protein [Dapis sp. BLCC M126]|uniref:phage tail protein n=1 Tax=Dapis sp. BLCC M126 TaxID=3400189 RepID=UPI003CE945E2